MASTPASHTPEASACQGKEAAVWLGVWTVWPGFWIAVPGLTGWVMGPPDGALETLSGGTVVSSPVPAGWPWEVASSSPIVWEAGTSVSACGTAEKGLSRLMGSSSRANTMSHSRHTACRGARFLSAKRSRSTTTAT